MAERVLGQVISGASLEMWFGGKALQTLPVNHYQETCVTVTWIKLSHQAMSADGKHWAKYTPLSEHHLPGSRQCGMNINCCDASGPRGRFNLPAYVVMQSAEGLFVNYFMPGEYELTTPSGKQIVFTQQTTYPENGEVKLASGLE